MEDSREMRIYGDINTFIHQAVLANLAKYYKVKIAASIGAVNFRDSYTVKFTLPGGKDKFRFWKYVDLPGEGDDDHSWFLHIVPPYHPVISGQEAPFLINGANDAVINSDTIISLHCPEESIVEEMGKRSLFVGSWGYVKHPFLAEGSSFEVAIRDRCYSRKDFAILQQILLAALGLNGEYVAVSGGFNSPYEDPASVMKRHGKVYARNRGSEPDCVWEYRTLQKEGNLRAAIIPSWFLEEEWLDLYEGEQPEW